jgi:hypothetical protein
MVDLSSMSNNIGSQNFLLFSENDEGDNNEDDEDNNVIGIQKPTRNEKRRGSWGNLIRWRRNGIRIEEKESEALISSSLNGEEEEEDDRNNRGGGDISTSNLSYKNSSNSIEENDSNSKDTEELDLMLFTTLETAKDDIDNDNDNGSTSCRSPTSVVIGCNDSSEDERSENSSDDSSNDLNKQSDDKNENDEYDERVYVLSKDTSNRHRPTLARRSLSTKSFFIDKENNSDFLHGSSSRMEGFGNSSSIPDIPSSPLLTFRERLKVFVDGTGRVKKMNTVADSSWSNNMNTVNTMPFGTSLATQYEDDEHAHEVTLPSRVRSSYSGYEYIARIERELGKKDIEVTSWKDRAKELEEEVNRLKEIIGRHSLHTDNDNDNDILDKELTVIDL